MKVLNNIYVIFLREFKSYITSPMIYVVLGLFFFLIGMIFLFQVDTFNELCKRASLELVSTRLSSLDLNFHILNNYLKNIGFICLFVLPILTMRLIADEKKNRTIELLMTSPITSAEIIIGKFLAINLIWACILILFLIYPFILMNLPFVHIDWGMYFTGLLGLLLYGALGIALGLFASTLTDNQLVAAVVGFSLIAALYFIIFLAIKTDTPFGNFMFSVSVLAHFSDFLNGLIDTKNIIYFVTATLFVLFVSERSLESQRWR